MNLTRRDLAVVGVFALSATTLIVPAMAGTDDEEAVKQAVEALRKAILAQDKMTLETTELQPLGRPSRRQDQIHQRNHDAKGCLQVA